MQSSGIFVKWHTVSNLTKKLLLADITKCYEVLQVLDIHYLIQASPKPYIDLLLWNISQMRKKRCYDRLNDIIQSTQLIIIRNGTNSSPSGSKTNSVHWFPLLPCGSHEFLINRGFEITFQSNLGHFGAGDLQKCSIICLKGYLLYPDL